MFFEKTTAAVCQNWHCVCLERRTLAKAVISLVLINAIGVTLWMNLSYLLVGGSFMHQLFSADEASKLSTCVKSLRIRFEKDSKQWEETELTNAIHKDASSACNSYKYQSEYVYGNSTNIFGHPTKPKYQSKDVTLMVHLTSDRIEKLIRLTENWSGPISAAIYVDNITDSLMIENICHFQSRPNIFIHILHKVGGIYPSSIIRNLALEEVFTEYAFLSDVDFMPAPSVYKTSVDLIKSKNRLLSKTTAFVVAAFELKRNTTPDGDAVKFPRNKSDLLALQNSTLIQPFHYHRERHYGHFSTNYEAWNIAKTTYKAKWVGLYEPYVIVNTCAVPRYNNAFVGRYFDKYSHLLELYSAGYEFWVLPNVFVVHLPHENQKDGIGQSKCAATQLQSWRKQLKDKYKNKMRIPPRCR